MGWRGLLWCGIIVTALAFVIAESNDENQAKLINTNQEGYMLDSNGNEVNIEKKGGTHIPLGQLLFVEAAWSWGLVSSALVGASGGVVSAPCMAAGFTAVSLLSFGYFAVGIVACGVFPIGVIATGPYAYGVIANGQHAKGLLVNGRLMGYRKQDKM